MAETAKLWWYWRKRNDKVLTRSLIQFFLAIFCMVGFLVASITSSFVVSTSDLEVLVRSPLCGVVSYSTPPELVYNHITAISAISTPYAEECYRNQTVLPARCKAFVQPRISFTTERAACPFDIKFCTLSRTGNIFAIALDSDLVDLNAAFGLNLPKKDEVRYRRRTICTVLPLEGRTSIVDARDFPDALQATPDIPGEQLLIAHYGERPVFGEWRNTTTFYSLLRGNTSARFTVV
jgi:hypothetical protein